MIGDRPQPGWQRPPTAEPAPGPDGQPVTEFPPWVLRALDSIDDALIALDRQWRFVYVNRRAIEHARQPRERLLGRSLWDVYPELEGTPVETHYRRAMADQETIRFEMPGLFTSRWLEIQVYPTPDGLIICSRDGTNRKQTEDALRESESRFQAFMGNSTAVAWMKDEQLRYVYVNRPWEERFQIRLSAIRGVTDRDLPWPEISGQLQEHDRMVLSSGKTMEFEETVPDPDGRLRYWQVFKFPFQDSQGKKYVGGMAIDISERKTAEEQLRGHAERMAWLSRRLLEAQEAERRHLARELHDEIGQLLTGLKLSLEAALRHQEVDPGLDHNPQRLVQDLMRRIRDLSLDLRPSILDDLGLIPALSWQFERFRQQTGIQVVFEHQGVSGRFPAAVETAAYRIVQEALTNVARHAQVMDVCVRLGHTGTHLRVQVADQGTGFNPLQVSAGSSSGLSGMRERAALLNGILTVDSQPGAGTRLVAELPIEETPSE